MRNRAHLIETALGQRKADLVMKNAEIFISHTGEFLRGDLAIVDGRVAGIGEYDGTEVYDCTGRFLVPGFINAHLHIESSMLSPQEFAKAVVRNGTTTVVADPHEIANVAGLHGISYMLNATENLPIRAYFMLPS
ncbi:MAG: adenine deaminase, partial [Selenomonadaceae bacterium]|nr:adenine deaminase [Selenomonadaceae bacterium]